MRIRLATEGRISEPEGAVCADRCFMVDRDGRITSEHTHEDCIEFGFTPAELDAAEVDGGEWIDCPRDEEPYDSPARALVNICEGVAYAATETLQEKLDAVTEERDTLLATSKRLIHWFHGEHDPLESALPLWDASRAAIANVEPSWRWQNEPRRLPQAPPFPIKLPFDKLAEQRDALLEACKPVLPHLWHYDKLCPCDAVSRDIGSLVSAIAKAKPKKEKETAQCPSK